MFIFSYKAASKGAKALAKGLPAKRIKHRGSKLKGSKAKIVINWGASNVPAEVAKCTLINQPKAVGVATNKRDFFQVLKGLRKNYLPETTTDKAVALKWLEENNSVVCRSVLQGHSGEGITIADKPDQLVDAPLYVKYIKKQQEYRVHVINGEVIDIQRKARRKEVPDAEVNWRVRNHDNGFVFAREGGVKLHKAATDMALDVIKSLSLDFGAVDLIYNQGQGKYYALEVNTAPGLEGQTVENYIKAFKK